MKNSEANLAKAVLSFVVAVFLAVMSLTIYQDFFALSVFIFTIAFIVGTVGYLKAIFYVIDTMLRQ